MAWLGQASPGQARQGSPQKLFAALLPQEHGMPEAVVTSLVGSESGWLAAPMPARPAAVSDGARGHGLRARLERAAPSGVARELSGGVTVCDGSVLGEAERRKGSSSPDVPEKLIASRS